MIFQRGRNGSYCSAEYNCRNSCWLHFACWLIHIEHHSIRVVGELIGTTLYQYELRSIGRYLPNSSPFSTCTLKAQQTNQITRL